jgi:hypothetical protein
MSWNRAVVRVPATVPGRFELDVVSGNTVVTSGGILTVSATGIVVTGATPVCTSTDGDSAITITGSGFAPGAVVTINGVAVTNTSVTDASHIDVHSPALPAGFATIAVTNPNGDSGTATNALRVTSPLDPDGCGIAPRPRPIHH